MLGKTIGLFSLGLSTTSFLVWGGFEAYKNQEYNSRMWEYERWREEFFAKDDSTIKALICEDQENCEEYKEYLPKPNEDHLWNTAYKSFLANFQTNNYDNIENLKNIKNSEEWKDYCFKAIKKDNDGQENFNPSGKTKGHESCVLGKNELKR